MNQAIVSIFIVADLVNTMKRQRVSRQAEETRLKKRINHLEELHRDAEISVRLTATRAFESRSWKIQMTCASKGSGRLGNDCFVSSEALRDSVVPPLEIVREMLREGADQMAGEFCMRAIG